MDLARYEPRHYALRQGLTHEERLEARYRLLTPIHTRRRLAREITTTQDPQPKASSHSNLHSQPAIQGTSGSGRPISALRPPPQVPAPSYVCTTKRQQSRGSISTTSSPLDTHEAASPSTDSELPNLNVMPGSQTNGPRGLVEASSIVMQSRFRTGDGLLLAPLSSAPPGAGPRPLKLASSRPQTAIVRSTSLQPSANEASMSPDQISQRPHRPRPQTAIRSSDRLGRNAQPIVDPKYSVLPRTTSKYPTRPQTASAALVNSRLVSGFADVQRSHPQRPVSAIHVNSPSGAHQRTETYPPNDKVTTLVPRPQPSGHGSISLHRSSTPPESLGWLQHVDDTPNRTSTLTQTLKLFSSSLSTKSNSAFASPSKNPDSFIIRLYENLPPEAASWLWENAQSMYSNEVSEEGCWTEYSGDVDSDIESEDVVLAGRRPVCDVDYVMPSASPSDAVVSDSIPEPVPPTSSQKSARESGLARDKTIASPLDAYEKNRQSELERQRRIRERLRYEHTYSQGRYCRTTSTGQLRRPWRTFKVKIGQTTWKDLKAAMDAQFRSQRPDLFKSITPASLFAGRDPAFAASAAMAPSSVRDTSLTLTPMSTSTSTLRETRLPPPVITVRHALTGDEITCIDDLVPGIELVIGLASEPFAPSYTKAERARLQRRCVCCGALFTSYENEKHLNRMQIQHHNSTLSGQTQLPAGLEGDFIHVRNEDGHDREDIEGLDEGGSRRASSTHELHIRMCSDGVGSEGVNSSEPSVLSSTEILVHAPESPLVFPPVLVLPSVHQWQLARRSGVRGEYARAKHERRASLGLSADRTQRARPWRNGSKAHFEPDHDLPLLPMTNSTQPSTSSRMDYGVTQPNFGTEGPGSVHTLTNLNSNLLHKVVGITCACRRLPQTTPNPSLEAPTATLPQQRYLLVVWQANNQGSHNTTDHSSLTAPVDPLFTEPLSGQGSTQNLRRVAWTEIVTDTNNEPTFSRRLKIPIHITQESHKARSSGSSTVRKVKLERDMFLFCVYSLAVGNATETPMTIRRSLMPCSSIASISSTTSSSSSSASSTAAEWQVIAYAACRIGAAVEAAQHGGFFAVSMHAGGPEEKHLKAFQQGRVVDASSTETSPVLILSAPDIYNAYHGARFSTNSQPTGDSGLPVEMHNDENENNLEALPAQGYSHVDSNFYSYPSDDHTQDMNANEYRHPMPLEFVEEENEDSASTQMGSPIGPTPIDSNAFRTSGNECDTDFRAFNPDLRFVSEQELEKVPDDSEDEVHPSEQQDHVPALSKGRGSSSCSRSLISQIDSSALQQDQQEETGITTASGFEVESAEGTANHSTPGLEPKTSLQNLQVEVPHVEPPVTSPAVLHSLSMSIAIRLPGAGLAEFAANFKAYDCLELTVHAVTPASASALGLGTPKEDLMPKMEIRNQPILPPPLITHHSIAPMNPLEYSFVSAVSKANSTMAHHSRVASTSSVASDQLQFTAVPVDPNSSLPSTVDQTTNAPPETSFGMIIAGLEPTQHGARRGSEGQSTDSDAHLVGEAGFSFMSSASPESHISSMSIPPRPGVLTDVVPETGNSRSRGEGEILHMLLGPSAPPSPIASNLTQGPVLTRLVWNLATITHAASAVSGDIVTWRQSVCLPIIVGTGPDAMLLSSSNLSSISTTIGSTPLNASKSLGSPSESSLSCVSNPIASPVSQNRHNEYVFCLTATSIAAPPQFLGQAFVRVDEVARALEAETKQNENSNNLDVQPTVALAEVELDPSALAAPWINSVSKLSLCFALTPSASAMTSNVPVHSISPYIQ